MPLGLRTSAVGLLVVLCASVSCNRSSEPFQPGDADIPGQFQVDGRRYILSQKDPGIVRDDSSRYMNDGGSRTFDFRGTTVDRDLFAGRRDLFDNLGPDEQRELGDIAEGALESIRQAEKQRPLSDLYQRHRQIFTAFVRHFPPNRPMPVR